MFEYNLDPSEQNLLDDEKHIVIPDSMRKFLGNIEEPGSRSFIMRGQYKDYLFYLWIDPWAYRQSGRSFGTIANIESGGI